MDEIQNCIADAQYGEALRLKSMLRPNEKFPDPGPEFNAEEFAAEQRVSLKSALSEPLGSYFFSRYVRENGGSPDEAFVFECLAGIRDFRRSADPTAAELVGLALRRLPIKFRRLRSFEVLATARDDTATDVVETESNASGKGMQRTLSNNNIVESDELNELEKQLREEVRPKWDPFTKSDLYVRYMKLKWYAGQQVQLKNFTIFRDLGRGAFGVVSGARFNTTGAMLAIKQMNKKLVKGKKAIKLVQAEKLILEKLGNRPSLFTIWLQYSWADKDQFYLALPLATGGDLAYHLMYQSYFEIERARFTGAEIVLGLGHLHALGIIYRDLKPENILLEETGHARISDMGLAIFAEGKQIKGRAGTPGYWAPEMLKKEKYGDEVDWWSFGCVLYEFLAGRCPFSKQNSGMERDEATLNWEIKFPQFLGQCAVTGGNDSRNNISPGPPFPEDARDLLEKLLCREPEKRLGYGRRGTEDVKNHPFFRSIDWPKLSVHGIDPPWIPKKEAIHAVNQSELDEKNTEYDYRKLKLSDADDIPNFFYCSTHAHQSDIVNVLELEANGKLEYLDRNGAPVWCCSTM